LLTAKLTVTALQSRSWFLCQTLDIYPMLKHQQRVREQY
jgi:hypothetical protein